MYHIQSIQSEITGSQSFGYVLDNTGAINPRQTHNINPTILCPEENCFKYRLPPLRM